MIQNPFLRFLPLFLVFVLFSCEDVSSPEIILSCEPSTQTYGGFILRFYDGNPNKSAHRRPSRQEAHCWSDLEPIQISAQGTGNCGEGYEMFENPFLGTSIVLGEYDPEISYFKRYLEVMGIFACIDFSTRESFYSLFTPANYGLAGDFENFGNFVIQYFEDGTNYSSIGLANSMYNVTLSDIEKGSINNADFVVATVKFNALLKAENGKYLKVENAEVRGRFFRMSPFGVEWDD